MAARADDVSTFPSVNPLLYSQFLDPTITPGSSSPDSGRDVSPSGLDSSSNGHGRDESQHNGKRRRTRASSSGATTPPPLFETPALSQKTHDISLVPYHTSNITNVAKQIEAAASEAWNRRFTYKAAYALLLYWEDDDLNVAPEVASLEATFREIYRYSTEIWKIGSKKPGLELKERLIKFLKENDANGNLVVFYYGGHAKPNPQPGGAPLWTS
jgi:hypothetical protein